MRHSQIADQAQADDGEHYSQHHKCWRIRHGVAFQRLHKLFRTSRVWLRDFQNGPSTNFISAVLNGFGAPERGDLPQRPRLQHGKVLNQSAKPLI